MPTTRAAITVDKLLASLPDDRRQEVTRVLDVIRRCVPPGYVESAASGMISWTVPLSVYPDTNNKQPLWYTALAVNKSGLSLHLMPVYADATQEKRLRDAFAAAGKRLDMEGVHPLQARRRARARRDRRHHRQRADGALDRDRESGVEEEVARPRATTARGGSRAASPRAGRRFPTCSTAR